MIRDERIAILVHQSGAAVDNIREYSLHLADAINERTGIRAEVYTRFKRAHWKSPDGTVRRDFDGYRAIVLQYNPFAFGRRGFAPSLAIGIFLLRRGPRRLAVLPRCGVAVLRCCVRTSACGGR